MRRIQLLFERPGDGSSGYPLGDSANEAASFSRPKHLPWLIILVVGLTFSVDYLTAAQQQRLLKLTVTRHIMAALQEEADQPIDRSQRANWITPDADGNINGRISALDSSQDSASESAVQPENAEASPMDYLTVALVAQGEEVAKAKTDEKGRFELAGVEPGVYTLVGYGNVGFWHTAFTCCLDLSRTRKSIWTSMLEPMVDPHKSSNSAGRGTSPISTYRWTRSSLKSFKSTSLR